MAFYATGYPDIINTGRRSTVPSANQQTVQDSDIPVTDFVPEIRDLFSSSLANYKKMMLGAARRSGEGRMASLDQDIARSGMGGTIAGVKRRNRADAINAMERLQALGTAEAMEADMKARLAGLLSQYGISREQMQTQRDLTEANLDNPLGWAELDFRRQQWRGEQSLYNQMMNQYRQLFGYGGGSGGLNT